MFGILRWLIMGKSPHGKQITRCGLLRPTLTKSQVLFIIFLTTIKKWINIRMGGLMFWSLMWLLQWNLSLGLWFEARSKQLDFLYHMNLGPPNLCKMCGLDSETFDHLFRKFIKCQIVWRLVKNLSVISFNILDNTDYGNWLDFS